MNKRMRGRNNGRRGSGNLNRNFESNGPDVKVRGNAQTIAEKYVQLARDAQSAGDRVLAESYLQHAEHYFRTLMATQAAMGFEQRIVRSDMDDGEYDGEDMDGAEPSDPDAPQPLSGDFDAEHPQPRFRDDRGERFPRNDRPRFDGRRPRPERHEARDVERTGSGSGEQNTQRHRYEPRFPRHERPQQEQPLEHNSPAVAQPDTDRAVTSPERAPRDGFHRGGRDRFERRPRRERYEAPVDAGVSSEPAAALPSFITAPARVPSAPSDTQPVAQDAVDAAPVRAVRRPRRTDRLAEKLGVEPVAADAASE